MQYVTLSHFIAKTNGRFLVLETVKEELKAVGLLSVPSGSQRTLRGREIDKSKPIRDPKTRISKVQIRNVSIPQDKG